MAIGGVVQSCSRCGRATRRAGTSAAKYPNTVIRHGSVCTTCRHAQSQGTTRGSALATEPLTDDEQLVLRAIERECGDDAAEVAALLGLIREEVSS